MITKESILAKLAEGTNDTAKNFFTQEELDKFASFYIDKWDDITSEDVIAESFVDFWCNTKKPIRRCSECGSLMNCGYCYNQGQEYYCSDECRNNVFTDTEWETECEENDQSYYTEWF